VGPTAVEAGQATIGAQGVGCGEGAWRGRWGATACPNVQERAAATVALGQRVVAALGEGVEAATARKEGARRWAGRHPEPPKLIFNWGVLRSSSHLYKNTKGTCMLSAALAGRC
jgi:hypothetical protein